MAIPSFGALMLASALGTILLLACGNAENTGDSVGALSQAEHGHRSADAGRVDDDDDRDAEIERHHGDAGEHEDAEAEDEHEDGGDDDEHRDGGRRRR